MLRLPGRCGVFGPLRRAAGHHAVGVVGSARDTDGMSESEGFVARHPVATFVTLAYLLAWVWWIPLLADRQDVEVVAVTLPGDPHRAAGIGSGDRT